jgi:hypothetical protein
MELVDRLLDGRVAPAAHRSPFFRVPFLRTDFWPITAAAAVAAVGAMALLFKKSRT